MTIGSTRLFKRAPRKRSSVALFLAQPLGEDVASQGNHATISNRDEADRHAVYTYVLVGDLLRLRGATAAAQPLAQPDLLRQAA